MQYKLTFQVNNGGVLFLLATNPTYRLVPACPLLISVKIISGI